MCVRAKCQSNSQSLLKIEIFLDSLAANIMKNQLQLTQGIILKCIHSIHLKIDVCRSCYPVGEGGYAGTFLNLRKFLSFWKMLIHNHEEDFRYSYFWPQNYEMCENLISFQKKIAILANLPQYWVQLIYYLGLLVHWNLLSYLKGGFRRVHVMSARSQN